MDHFANGSAHAPSPRPQPATIDAREGGFPFAPTSDIEKTIEPFDPPRYWAYFTGTD